MLTELQLQQPKRRRAFPSLKQQYHAYILQRIEEFKNSLTRLEVLQLGNEAVGEMEAAGQEQLFLTEVVVAEWVDRIIQRRLNLQPYRRWVQSFRALRSAQREPTRWEIERRSPVVQLLRRLEIADSALVIGTEAASVAFLLAAHDVDVTYTAEDLTFVDQVEARAAEEVLGQRMTTLVAPIGHFVAGIPDRVHIVAIDTAALESIPASARRLVLADLMERTYPGGVHLLLPSRHAMHPEAFLSHYAEWTTAPRLRERRRPGRSLGVMFCKPPMIDLASECLPRPSGASA